jgi:hypothetical protein
VYRLIDNFWINQRAVRGDTDHRFHPKCARRPVITIEDVIFGSPKIRDTEIIALANDRVIGEQVGSSHQDSVDQCGSTQAPNYSGEGSLSANIH